MNVRETLPDPGTGSRLPDLGLPDGDPAETPCRDELAVDGGHNQDELRADLDGEGARGDGADGGAGRDVGFHAPFIEPRHPSVAPRREES